MKIEWAYLRKGWQASKKAQEFLDANKIDIENITYARKQRYDENAAWDLISGAGEIITAKGKKVQKWNPQKDDKQSILKQVMGPTTNLRVPVLHFNDVFVVGFNQEAYEEHLKGKG